jgi:hypothetical protein
MPKSASNARPDTTKMFSGLTSRWTMPALCAKASASATSAQIAHASSIVSRRSRVSRARSVSPGTYGMT